MFKENIFKYYKNIYNIIQKNKEKIFKYDSFNNYFTHLDNVFYQYKDKIYKLLKSVRFINNYDSIYKLNNKSASEYNIDLVLNDKTYEILELNESTDKNPYPLQIIKNNDEINITLSDTKNYNFTSIQSNNDEYKKSFKNYYLPFDNNFPISSSNMNKNKVILYLIRKISLPSDDYTTEDKDIVFNIKPVLDEKIEISKDI